MKEKTLDTPIGTIHYWTNILDTSKRTLVLLPGLTADHRLFDQQVQHFESRYNILVWDAPGHGKSRPFTLSFSLDDKVKWLHEILELEHIVSPILIGQSMGGYVAQCYMDLFPGSIAAFVSIDSAPLQRKYVSGLELWLLARMEPVYRLFPWSLLQYSGSKGCSTSPYGQSLMREMMQLYSHKEYCALAGHGFKILAAAIAEDRPYRIDCPCLLICGQKDQAGSVKSYNKRWSATESYPLKWIPKAGHNSNTDAPELVNDLIEAFVQKL